MLVLVWPIINATPRQTENIKKEICQIFNRNGLHITIEANKQVVNFLDVTLNLHKSTYQPFTKPNTTLLYVHRESNHPQSITRNIPAGINKRLSTLSSDKASFDQATPPYQETLNENGYNYTLVCPFWPACMSIICSYTETCNWAWSYKFNHDRKNLN